MKYKDIKENEEVQALISKGNENLGILGIQIIQKYMQFW
jgi:hypothetical protein